tara:strand:+ start:11089 stop:14604 length:3516 start_codon:yes stop_codon:yes gene_type:complete
MTADQTLKNLDSATPVAGSAPREYLTGVQALVRLPLAQLERDRAAGLRTEAFVTGYPGSPLGGYDMALDRAKVGDHGVRHVHAQNEELAATSIMGTQMLDGFPHDSVDGVVSFWYGKGPGVDRSGDAFKHGNFAGTSKHGAVVILSGEDHEAKSSSVPYQQEFAFEHAGIPVLYPGSVTEFLDYGLHAVALSRYSGCWVAMKLVAPLCDGGEVIDPAALGVPVVPEDLEIEGKPFSKATDFNFFPVLNVGTEARLYNERHEAVLAYARANGLNTVTQKGPNDRIGIVTAGKSHPDVRAALSSLGMDDSYLSEQGVRIAKVGLLCPSDTTFFRDFATGLDLIIVVEEKRDFLERQVAHAIAGHSGARIIGKHDLNRRRLFPVEGGMDIDIVTKGLARVLDPLVPMPAKGKARLSTIALADTAPPPKLFSSRTPNYCSGCPHNRSTKLPDGQIAWGAPGCHVFAAIMEQPERRIEAMTQYGGEGLPWIGLSPYTSKKHIVQNIGDGSYYHSSNQNIRYAVTTGQRMTFRILYNGVIANTGGQDYASSNSIEKLCRRLEIDGVKKIVLATKDPSVYQRRHLPDIVALRQPDEIPAALKELEKVDGVTVLIYDGDCANERRRRQKRGLAPKPVKFTVVNEDVCENCGDCGRKANCMSLQKVETRFGKKTQIHQSSCNQDRACVEGDCPSFVSVHVKEGTGPGKVALPDIPDDMADPVGPNLDRPYSIYIPGVGGTGVITLNAMLAQAAMHDGLNVKTYDQTGAAQKWGAVLSSLIVSHPDTEIIGNKVATRSADLYLAADMVAGAEPVNLKVCDKARTVAAVGTDILPTGEMIRDVFFQPDTTGIRDYIATHAMPGGTVTTPALTIAERLFGNYILSNMVTVGAAYQAGYLPISAAAIEKSMEAAGSAAKSNILAFRAGRLSIADPDRLAGMMESGQVTLADRFAETSPVQSIVETKVTPLMSRLSGLPDDTTALVAELAADLVIYQNLSYARRYTERLSQIAEITAERAPAQADRLVRLAAKNLHKIMAYKDEYEVARLLTDPVFETRLRKAYPGMVGMSYNLQPPTFRWLSPARKVEIGGWFRPALSLLARMKTLRGTAFDPFGRNPARRAELEAVKWYEGVLETVSDRLTLANADTCAEMIALPDDIRGYEDLKTESLARAKIKATDLTEQL